MKDYIVFVAIFILLLVLLPFIITVNGKSVNNSETTYAVASIPHEYTKSDIVFKVYDSESDTKAEISGYEFICGIVAGEMPCEYNSEALKAQAVAAFSYCLCRKNEYINTCINVAYLKDADAKKFWGEKYEENLYKIRNAVSEVYGNAIYYKNEIADAYYFSTSSGNTENGKDVFGNDKPYLVSVSCPGDVEEKDYLSNSSISLSEFKNKVSSFNSKADFSGPPQNYIKNISRSNAGGIISVELCGKKVSGIELRELFSLRSTNISFNYENNKFNFSVKGYGHGVGMSQTEAEHLAEKGKTWREILEYFYKGTETKNYFETKTS